MAVASVASSAQSSEIRLQGLLFSLSSPAPLSPPPPFSQTSHRAAVLHALHRPPLPVFIAVLRRLHSSCLTPSVPCFSASSSVWIYHFSPSLPLFRHLSVPEALPMDEDDNGFPRALTSPHLYSLQPSAAFSKLLFIGSGCCYELIRLVLLVSFLDLVNVFDGCTWPVVSSSLCFLFR